MANNSDEVIDLTDSFTLANHCTLTNAVIEVFDTDESLLNSPLKPAIAPSKKRKFRKSKVKVQAAQTDTSENVVEHKKIGDCPICYDTLGKKPLAATKCGHIFCMQCLKQCLKTDRKCPTCRNPLKSSSGYHPLYF